MLTSLRNRFAAVEPIKWIGGGLAVSAVLGIASLFYLEYRGGYWKPEPEIVYFQSWTADRTAEDAAAVQAEERRIREEVETLADRLATEALAGSGPADDSAAQ
ncbi:MAG: hypothetical protein AAF205_01365 [Pseudomonadota bacterium]